MKVADLMKTDLAVVNEDISLKDAIIQLADARVRGVPVVDRRGRLVGVLSASDVVQATAEQSSTGERGEVFEEMPVRDLMSTPPQTIGPDEDVRRAAQQMLTLDVHRLFVVSTDELLGVISQSDLVRAVAKGSL
ncbi:MAG: CBS domain-containing protein [Gemmatimonadota bacterium]|nr:CBS domain-containing protein [Gemmatimonadota bacterium]MDH3367384.1 CBS domain-containing protein [Gemmatimonadota bacterium]MDH3477593.1 CBS domain-containing protein [Gemmatimonadota bacterium]MDH3570831.1 CBS domain-containing protein [Gemmatimonadota bacterium]MDH5548684.1 CBS domain-containing protein [Gemmatimonadota bacterium]